MSYNQRNTVTVNRKGFDQTVQMQRLGLAFASLVCFKHHFCVSLLSLCFIMLLGTAIPTEGPQMSHADIKLGERPKEMPGCSQASLAAGRW